MGRKKLERPIIDRASTNRECGPFSGGMAGGGRGGNIGGTNPYTVSGRERDMAPHTEFL